MDFPDLDRHRAVNRILRSAGEYPVNSLTDDGINDTAVAEDTLDDATIQVQMNGLTSNTVVQTLNPATDGTVALPEAVLSVEHKPEASECLKVLTNRARKLYNVTDGTDQFSDPISVTLVIGLPFEELPMPIRYQIVEIACRAYQLHVVGEESVDRVLAERETKARIEGRRFDMQTRRANHKNNYMTQKIIGRNRVV